MEWQIQEYGLSVHSFYTEIQNNELDEIVRATKRINPKCGSKIMMGYLGSRGIFVTRHHVRDVLSRVDRQRVATQWCTAIK